MAKKKKVKKSKGKDKKPAKSKPKKSAPKKGKSLKKSAGKKKPSKGGSKKGKDDEDEAISGDIDLTVGGGDFDYDPLPDDEYLNCKVHSYKQQMLYDKFKGEKRAKITLRLELEDHTFENEETGETGQRSVWGMATASLNEKATLYKWVKGILGRDLKKGENISLDDLIGLPCRVMVVTKEREDGSIAQYIEKIKPPKDGKKGKKARDEEEEDDGPRLADVKKFCKACDIKVLKKDDVDSLKEKLSEYAWDQDEDLSEKDTELLVSLGLLEPEEEEEDEDEDGEEEEDEEEEEEEDEDEEEEDEEDEEEEDEEDEDEEEEEEDEDEEEEDDPPKKKKKGKKDKGKKKKKGKGKKKKGKKSDEDDDDVDTDFLE